jgi:porphobilinogen deaminase
MDEGGLRLDGVVLDRLGRQRLEASAAGGDALALGQRVAQSLLEQGADRLLERQGE